ncbi:MAG: cation-translocating P-type ATPase [Chloroflexota bacterium]
MAEKEMLELPVRGMDCAECTLHVRKALASLPGVENVEVFLAAEKAVVRFDPQLANLQSMRQVVEQAGYSIPEVAGAQEQVPEDQTSRWSDFTRPVLTLLGVVFGAVLFIVVVGEWLGLFEAITRRVPWPVGAAVVLLAGYPVLRNVVRAALQKQVIAHTLMSLGVAAALVVGEWATAAVIVFFMRVGDYVEHFTAERARRAVRDLTRMAPKTARIERDGVEIEIPVEQVQPGEAVIVRPGEMIPVDGEVLSGQATVNQASITGESMPVEAEAGARVFAASLVQMGMLRVRATQVGADTTFGRVIRLVEQAEANRAEVQRVADRFSGYYLPVVVGVAALTFLLRRDPLATAAVLVVACSCSFALATPIAMLASIGAGARRGLMIKGGKYLELLAKADVLLIDKTGTLTTGKAEIVEMQFLADDLEALALAAAAERYSEHPLAEAVRAAAQGRGLSPETPEDFTAIPGLGVRATVRGRRVEVGNRRMLSGDVSLALELAAAAQRLEAQGETLVYVAVDGELAGVLAAADRLRPEVPQAIQALCKLGIRKVELLTGDNERVAGALAGQLEAQLCEGMQFSYRANLLPEDKIEVVKAYQAQGHTVVMVGDGVNDAPALAQADVGLAMGAAGSDVAIEAAHIALMRDDWLLVPEVVHIARRTMGVVKLNIAFTAVYNLVGLSLAALGFLPPIFAAAAQSLPDLGILANSSRLIRQAEMKADETG